MTDDVIDDTDDITIFEAVPTFSKEETLRIGSTLAKICDDVFYAAIGTRDGLVFCFESASVEGDWVFLSGSDAAPVLVMRFADWDGSASYCEVKTARPLRRGCQVRLSDIIWVADAPEGS